ncbi:uncharacterized protein LOC128171251 [Crassostrea angulata]|uniref:uncharacterized protein LOC128171251 n=1 Tax=Magallana angulata TaxID=2784310 RepID=UPI0022B0D260|nr:uncharacterized protein LOC128171251 [Crassostrea angulata]
MAVNRLFLLLVIAFELCANQKSKAEVVRRLEKPALQTLALSASPINDTLSARTGVFIGPSDTQIQFSGQSMKINKEENDVFSVRLTTTEFNLEANSPFGSRMLKIKSNSAKEAMRILFNLNSNARRETKFHLNNCKLEIEKRENGTQTEYKARVENCADEDGFEKYFVLDLNFKSGDASQIYSKDLNGPDIQRVSKYFKYAKTFYTSTERDTYYTILNNPALEADEITITNFHFTVSSKSNPSLFSDDLYSTYYWNYYI